MAERRGGGAVVGIAVIAAMVSALFLGRVFLFDDDPPKLLLIGDSVTFLSAGAIDQRFDREHLQYLTMPGFTTGDLLPLVDEALGQPDGIAAAREQVVVLVGYNDVATGTIETDALVAMAERTSTFDCAVWLTLPARPGGQPSVDDSMAVADVERWNERLAAVAESSDNLRLVDDWQDAVEADATLLEDGVHPTSEGQQVLAEIMRVAVGRTC